MSSTQAAGCQENPMLAGKTSVTLRRTTTSHCFISPYQAASVQHRRSRAKEDAHDCSTGCE
eukprot:1160922-Pelagomonas_calceolata.AAC.8